MYTEEKEDEVSDGVSEITERATNKSQSRHVQALEDYFDDFGGWRDPFLVPATQDILLADFDETIRIKKQESAEEEEAAHRTTKGLSEIGQKVLAMFDEINPRKGKKIKKKKANWSSSRPELEFLEGSPMMQLLESCHYLVQILTFDAFEAFLQMDTFDLALLKEGSTKDNKSYMRHVLRQKHCLEQTFVWFERFKAYILQVVRGQMPGQTKEMAYDLLKQVAKYKYQMAFLGCIQCARDTRDQEDMESVHKIRRFLVNLALNSQNLLYNFDGKLYFNEENVRSKLGKWPIPREISLSESENIQLLNYFFAEPVLERKSRASLSFSDFMWQYESIQNHTLSDLFTLKRDVKVQIASRIADSKLRSQRYLMNQEIMPDNAMIAFIRESNYMLKNNIKAVLMQEAILCLKEKIQPFTTVSKQALASLNSSICHQYYRALGDYIEAKREMDPKKEGFTKLKVVGEDINNFQPDIEKITILRETLAVELEKLLLHEGTTYCMKNLKRIKASKVIMKVPRISMENNEREEIMEEMSQHRFLPLLYGFTSKTLNKSLFIRSHNMGQCIVIPVLGLEQQLHDLNAGIVKQFEDMEHQIHEKYIGKISILETQLDTSNKSNERMAQELELTKKEHARVLEARVAETGSKLKFQVDMLKKKIKSILEEHEFVYKENEERIRQGFKDQLMESEMALKLAKKRFFEFKEGMTFDFTRFVEHHKSNAIKSVLDKKNQIFITGSVAGQGGSLEAPGDTFEMDETKSEKVMMKLYEILKKTRILYQFREIVIKEKCEKELHEMKEKLIANQGLLQKVNDLQNNEDNLKDGLTDIKKEMVIIERQNNGLRKNLQKSSNEKIRLHKKNNMGKVGLFDLESRYEDALKRKVIFVPEEEPLSSNGYQSKYFLKSHTDILNGSKTCRNTSGLFEQKESLALFKRQSDGYDTEGLKSPNNDKIRSRNGSRTFKAVGVPMEFGESLHGPGLIIGERDEGIKKGLSKSRPMSGTWTTRNLLRAGSGITEFIDSVMESQVKPGEDKADEKKAMTDRNRAESISRISGDAGRPKSSFGMRTPVEFGRTVVVKPVEKKEKLEGDEVKGHKRVSSYVEVKSPKESQIMGVKLKSGKKVKKTDQKAFLLKKFVQKEVAQGQS